MSGEDTLTPLRLRCKMAWAVLRGRSVMYRMQVRGVIDCIHCAVEDGACVIENELHGRCEHE